MENINELITASAFKMSALEELYYLLKNDVFAFAYSILRDFQLSEDCLQETFLRLPKAAANFSTARNGTTYILAITKNIAKEMIRSERKQRNLSEDEAKSVHHYSSSVSDIEGLLNQLNKKQAQIVNLYVYSQLTFKEIAVLLHLPESTVKSRYQKAIKVMQNLSKGAIADGKL
jgi:RNA polymerase sigma factor (sigma-70 family)